MLATEETLQYESNGYNTSTPVKGIMVQLATIPLPDEIRQLANQIYLRMGSPIRRGKERLLLIYYCISSAYRECRCPFDDLELCKQLNIQFNATRSVENKFGQLQTGYRPPPCVGEVENLLLTYGEKLGLDSDVIDLMTKKYHELLAKEKLLMDESPPNVTGGLICHFLDESGAAVDKRKLAGIVGKSVPTIISFQKKLAVIDSR